MSDTTGSGQGTEEIPSSDGDIGQARADFRAALLAANRTHNADRQLHTAAAAFCREARQLGRLPERVVVDAKQVIEETIDGDNAMLASRAVSICIEQYFRN